MAVIRPHPRPGRRRACRSPLPGRRPASAAACLAVLCALSAVGAICGGIAPAIAVPSGPGADGGGWRLPVAGGPEVVYPFDPPARRWEAGHRGVDLAATPGQPVVAPAGGVVTFAGAVAGRGVVTVTVGRLRTTLEPVAPVVRRGERVVAGQVVGHVQTVGSHCLPATCLHWGLLRGETYLDPLPMLGPGSADIVLLPLSVAPPAPSASWGFAAPFPDDLDAGPPAAGAGRAIEFARAQLGDPYVWAATGPDAWDCSGLTMAAWAAAGRFLPRTSSTQYAASTPVSGSELRPGDLVFWATDPADPGTIFHVGLYIGAGQMVHAPRPGAVVRVEGIRSWAEPSFFGRV